MSKENFVGLEVKSAPHSPYNFDATENIESGNTLSDEKSDALV